jgi:hypothetical protein
VNDIVSPPLFEVRLAEPLRVKCGFQPAAAPQGLVQAQRHGAVIGFSSHSSTDTNKTYRLFKVNKIHMTFSLLPHLDKINNYFINKLHMEIHIRKDRRAVKNNCFY